MGMGAGWGLGVGVFGCVQGSVFAKVFERNAAKKSPHRPPAAPSPQGPLQRSSPVWTFSIESNYLMESRGGDSTLAHRWCSWGRET